MSTEIPLLVGAGSVPERRMREAAEALAKLWAICTAGSRMRKARSRLASKTLLQKCRWEGWPGKYEGFWRVVTKAMVFLTILISTATSLKMT